LFFCEKCSIVLLKQRLAGYFFDWAQRCPYPNFYVLDTTLFTDKYFCGGPRWPKISMVMSVPVWQQGHFLSSVFTFDSGRFRQSVFCRVCSFPRFQLLLKIP